MGHGELLDSMISDGLWCAFEQCHMGNSGEVVAEHYHVGRQAQDEFAARSHQKAARATEAGWFKEEIIQAFYDGMRHRPETTFGTVNADVLADKDPSFQPENFCRVIRASAWSG